MATRALNAGLCVRRHFCEIDVANDLSDQIFETRADTMRTPACRGDVPASKTRIKINARLDKTVQRPLTPRQGRARRRQGGQICPVAPDGRQKNLFLPSTWHAQALAYLLQKDWQSKEPVDAWKTPTDRTRHSATGLWPSSSICVNIRTQAIRRWASRAGGWARALRIAAS